VKRGFVSVRTVRALGRGDSGDSGDSTFRNFPTCAYRELLKKRTTSVTSVTRRGFIARGHLQIQLVDVRLRPTRRALKPEVLAAPEAPDALAPVRGLFPLDFP